jgi:WD40 repeat protein
MLIFLFAIAAAPLPTRGDQHDWALADVRALVWAGDNTAVIAGTATGGVVLWNAQSGREIRRWKADKGLVALSLRGDVLVTGSERGRIQLWEWKTGKQLRTFNTANQLRSLCLHPDGKSLAFITATRAIRWNLLDGKEIERLIEFNESTLSQCVSHSPDGRHILVTGESNSLGGWRGAWYSRWAFSDGNTPCDGGGNAAQNPDPVWYTRRLGHCIAWMPDSQHAYFPGVDCIYGYSRDGTSGPASYRGYPAGMAYTPDGKHLIYADISGIVRRLDGRSLTEMASMDGLGPIEHFALSPDGKRFVVANERKVMLRVLPKESPR